jgi:5-methylcytosine-specific restriction enzyme A
MTRAVPEWIGASDDTKVPTRVQLRVHERQGGKCAITGVKLVAGKSQCDHIIALINGGENRERNLQIIATMSHKEKTKADTKLKAKIAAIRGKDTGIIRPAGNIKSAGFVAVEKPMRAMDKANALPRRSMFKAS